MAPMPARRLELGILSADKAFPGASLNQWMNFLGLSFFDTNHIF